MDHVQLVYPDHDNDNNNINNNHDNMEIITF